MAFEDIKDISYKQLIEHSQKVKPYRDSEGAYNLGERRYSDRHFRVRDNGVISVFFSYMQNVRHRIEQGESEYTTGRHLANIHPDNSMEIINSSGQGDIMFLSSIMPYVTHSKAHHGLMIRSSNRWKEGGIEQSHPVFRGGRYSLDSHETVTPYILQPKMVDRKMRKQVVARFDLFKKVGLTMFNALSPSGIYEIYKELWNEYGEDAMHRIDGEVIVKLVNDNKPLDALLLSMLSKGDFGWWGMWKIRQLVFDEMNSAISDHRVNAFLGESFNKIVNETYLNIGEEVGKLDDLLIKGSPDAFHYKDPIPNGQAIPSSKWGYKLTDMSGNNLIRI
jgi:hypothetical protein